MQSRRSGITLIEILGALVLLSTLLVGILAAKGRLVKQLARAEITSHAVQAADRLLTNWWQDPARFPRNSQGQIEGSFAWKTAIVANEQAKALGADVVALDILDPQAPGRSLVHVEVMLPQTEVSDD